MLSLPVAELPEVPAWSYEFDGYRALSDELESFNLPLQNRVTPFGEIVALNQRGLFIGNRGIIHNPATRTLLKRRWTTKAWITCRCDYKDVRRVVMARRSWTELFFLDEATALAAGHRPCFFCRRAAAEAFARLGRRVMAACRLLRLGLMLLCTGKDCKAAPSVSILLQRCSQTYPMGP
jgi:hypothetical protein